MATKPCSCCGALGELHRPSNLCDECWRIWLAEEQKHEAALVAAVQHLYSFGIGQYRIADILDASLHSVKRIISTKVDRTARKPTLGKRITPICGREGCGKQFTTYVYELRRRKGRYCSLTCWNLVQRQKHPRVRQLLSEGYRPAEIAQLVGLAACQVHKIKRSQNSGD